MPLGGERLRTRFVRIVLPLAVLAPLAAGCGAVRGLQSAQVQSAPAIRIGKPVQATFTGSPPTEYDLTDAAMATPDLGFAVGTGMTAAEGSYVLHTSDGGRHFQKLYYSPQQIVSMAVPNPQHAYLLSSDYVTEGEYTAALSEVSPGSTRSVTLWHVRNVAASSVSFPTLQDGFIAAVAVKGMASVGAGQLYVTHDDGASWAERPLPCGTLGAQAIDFTGPETGWLLCGGLAVIGKQAKVLDRTTDGGLHWSQLASTGLGWTSGSLPIEGSPSRLTFLGPEAGYIMLFAKGLLRTTDGGKAWTLQNVARMGGDPVAAIGFLPGGFGWVLGGKGAVLSATRDGGANWRQIYAPPVPSSGISITGPKDAIGLETDLEPRLTVTSDGGANWTEGAPLPFAASALQALSGRNLVAIGGGGVEISRNAGRVWSKLDLPSGWRPVSLGYRTPSGGWVVAEGPDESHAIFDCGEKACRKIATPFTPVLARATGPQAGIAAGRDKRGRPALFTTLNGGAAWQEQVLPAEFGTQSGAVTGLGARENMRWLYSPGTILLSQDGGRRWKEITLPGIEQVVSLDFSGPAHGLLVTSTPMSGILCWETSDGGVAFTLP